MIFMTMLTGARNTLKNRTKEYSCHAKPHAHATITTKVFLMGSWVHKIINSSSHYNTKTKLLLFYGAHNRLLCERNIIIINNYVCYDIL